MFGQMMDAIGRRLPPYVMHVQVVATAARARPHPGPVRGGGGPFGRSEPPRRLSGPPAPRRRPPWPPAPGCLTAWGPAVNSPTVPSPPRAHGPHGRGPPAGGEGADREAGPQRALLVRERARSFSCAMARAKRGVRCRDQRDPKAELAALRSRLIEAQGYLRLDALRERRAELEKEVSRPDLWDDADLARRITSEFGSVGDDIELLEDLDQRLSDAEVLYQLMVEEGDDSVAGELTGVIDDLARRLDDLELRSLFTGEYDQNDAIVELHSGAGGTTPQDGARCSYACYQRWAERRGFDVEIDEATAGQEAGLLSATFIVKGRFAYGLLSAERGVHRLVRMSPFDSQHRRQTSFASLDVTPFLEDLSDESGDRGQGTADRHLPLLRRRRSACQQDGLGRPAHPPPHRGSWCRSRTNAASTKNKAKAMQILGPNWPSATRRAALQLDSLFGPPVRRWPGVARIRSYVMGLIS